MNRKIIFTIAPFAVVASTLVGCKKQATKVTSITATSAKTTYMKDDAINKNDIVVEATYDTGDKQKITGWQCDDFNEDNNYVYKFDTGGSKTFNIKYSNCETSIKFNVASIVTKAEWLDVYEGIYNNFQSSTKEYMTHNITSFVYDYSSELMLNLTPYKYVYQVASNTRVLGIKGRYGNYIFPQDASGYFVASVRYNKNTLSTKLKDSSVSGVKYLISDNYIEYIDANATTSGEYKNLSYDKDGYLLDDNKVGYQRLRLQYDGNFREKPDTVTSTVWANAYQTASNNFQNNITRYTKSDISVKGYVSYPETKQYHIINAKVCNFNSYVYKEKNSSDPRKFYVSCELENQEGTMIPLAGGSLEYSELITTINNLSSSCDIDFYVNSINNSTRVMLYLKLDGSLYCDLLFNSNGYCERYYQKGVADLTITYKDDALSDCQELYPCGLMSSKIGETIISYGQAFSKFTEDVTFSSGKRYLFTCVVEPIYNDTTKKNILFGVKKLCFTNSSESTVLTSDNIESLKASTIVNGIKKDVNVSLSNGEIILENEITTQGTEITIEFKTITDIVARKIYTNGTTL